MLTSLTKKYDLSTIACKRLARVRSLSKRVKPSCWMGPTEVGSGAAREEAVALSRLINIINDRFGTDFTQVDQFFFDQIVEAAVADNGLQQAAAVNPEDKFELVFKNLLEHLFVERMDQNEEIFVRYMNDTKFGK